jgi:hypothetical protein
VRASPKCRKTFVRWASANPVRPMACVTLALITLAATGFSPASGSSVAQGPKPTASLGVLTFRQISHQKPPHRVPGRLAFVRIFRGQRSKAEWTVRGGAPLSGGSRERAGRYRIHSFDRHCRHCLSDPKFFGRKFARCSHQAGVEARARTIVSIRLNHKHRCSMLVRERGRRLG